MLAATIHLYDNSEERGFLGYIEPPDKEWIIFINMERQLIFYRITDDKTITTEGETVRYATPGKLITHSAAINIIINGGDLSAEVTAFLNTIKNHPEDPPKSE